MRVWAIRIKYLSSIDNKWHRHTTRWFTAIEDAWTDKELFETIHKEILESSSSLIHKEKKTLKKKVYLKRDYYQIPKDLPEGRYNCVLLVRNNKRRLIVKVDQEEFLNAKK